MRTPKLFFGFLLVLGILFLTIFFTVFMGSVSPALGYLMWFLVIGGTVSLITGLLGAERQFSRISLNWFIVLADVLIPLCIIFALSYSIWIGKLFIGF